MSDKGKWTSIDLDCWNYLKKSQGGSTTRIRIGPDRFCTSNCENTWCPLNKEKVKP